MKIFTIFLLLILVSCSSNKIADYPKYTDQVKSIAEKEVMTTATNFENEVPDTGSIPNFVAPGFSFYISHPTDSKLTGTFRSDFNGILQLPYEVEVNINNKTIAEVKEIVMKSYRKFFQKGVEGVNFGLAKKEYWVEIRGLVKRPGRYLIKASDSLDLVVDQAGGVQGDISVDYFTAGIKQGKFDYQVLLNKYFESNENADKIRWFGGDSIFISKLDSIAGKSQEIPFVNVIGGVVKPGKVLYQKDASLFYFIEKSGGIVPGLGYEECFVFRNTKDGVKKIQFSFDHPETIPVIYPNDTIYMNNQVRTATDKLLERLVQIMSIVSTGALLIIAL